MQPHLTAALAHEHLRDLTATATRTRTGRPRPARRTRRTLDRPTHPTTRS